MRLLDRLKDRRLLLSFEITLGEKNEVGVKTALAEPNLDNLEFIRFWAFAAGRILYDIWFNYTPMAVLAIDRLSMILKRNLEPTTDCLKRAELYHFRYGHQVPVPLERIAGEYLGRNDAERVIRFSTKLPFDDNEPSPLVLVGSIALLQHVLDKFKADPRALHVLSATARTLVAQFAIKEWAGEASVKKLPQAAFLQALRQSPLLPKVGRGDTPTPPALGAI